MKKVGDLNGELDEIIRYCDLLAEPAENNKVTEKPWIFNDTTPFNGTEVVEELFRKEEFKPSC